MRRLVTPDGQRIPPLPTTMSLISPRLYQAFLNTNGNSMQEIVNFVSDYNLLLRFRFPTDDPQRDFYVQQQRMREVLTEAHEKSLSFNDMRQISPSHEESLVEADFLRAALLICSAISGGTRCSILGSSSWPDTESESRIVL